MIALRFTSQFARKCISPCAKDGETTSRTQELFRFHIHKRNRRKKRIIRDKNFFDELVQAVFCLTFQKRFIHHYILTWQQPLRNLMAQNKNLTQLLRQISEGDQKALNEVFPLVYDELRAIAHHRLARNRMGETLNTTALVHEAYMKLIDQSQSHINDRSHFFALSSVAMRHILVDYARSRSAAKRGGAHVALSLDDVNIAVEDRAQELLNLDQALEKLASVSERMSKVVEYKFFGGLTNEEVATVLGVSVPTVKRDWQFARTWLYQHMTEDQ